MSSISSAFCLSLFHFSIVSYLLGRSFSIFWPSIFLALMLVCLINSTCVTSLNFFLISGEFSSLYSLWSLIYLDSLMPFYYASFICPTFKIFFLNLRLPFWVHFSSAGSIFFRISFNEGLLWLLFLFSIL